VGVMNKRFAAFLLSASLLGCGIFTMPAWTQQPVQAPAKPAAEALLPEKFDLRTVDAVTPIKQQLGGTCWTHGTMAAIESHLLISGKWKEMKMKGIPMLSEYHLDWWNGFNQKYNEDLAEPDGKTGLKPHSGGDYRVAAAYISRGDGVVIIPEGKDGQDPKAWFKEAPAKDDPAYKRLYVRDIEWFTMGDNLEGIELIKRRIMKYGAIGTCYTAGKNISKEFIHYQPSTDARDPNHSVAIVGWDDNIISVEDDKKAPKPGAWLIKNSWGTNPKRTIEGYGWISYYDKHCCRNPEMGAVSFRNVEPLTYSHIYYHDAHGWRDTLPKVSKAFNAFTATGRESMRAVSFYTAQHNVDYILKIYSKFEGGKLSGEMLSQKGSIEFCGFHTIDVRAPVALKENDKFYVYLELSAGGQAIDRTSKIPVLLGQPQPKGKGGPIVLSKANPGESFYLDGTEWKDLYNYKFENPEWATFDGTANFCMKALCVSAK
jgi:C1A family cysteine protease